jgi:hypothetical protein
MAVAIKMGVTKEQLDSVVGIHPSAAEEFVTMRRWGGLFYLLIISTAPSGL